MARNPQNSPTKIDVNPPLNPIEQIARWFEAAVPTPSNQKAHTQIGIHFEEVSEMMQALKEAATSDLVKEQLRFIVDVLGYFQRQFKSGDLEVDFQRIDRVTLLGALCDQIVTTIGVAHMLGMNIEGALREVAASNDSRFGANGDPTFNKDRKILKDPRSRTPNLAPYTTKE